MCSVAEHPDGQGTKEHLVGAASEITSLRCELRDLMVVQPVRTPDESPLIVALQRAISLVTGLTASLVASPGTYDHKHLDRIAGIRHCVAYGPGRLDLAHQPDESCAPNLGACRRRLRSRANLPE